MDWIFGYGSLVWRPAFEYAAKKPGHIQGWTRRFFQGSPDHRGVATRPGRVVTLLPEAGARCWGMAYQLPEQGRDAITEALDHRERAGYRKHTVSVTFSDESPAVGTRTVEAQMYVADETNPSYLGPATVEAIAAHVRDAAGASGTNLEYVLELAAALRAMGAGDTHVFALEALLLDGGS